MIVDFLMSTKQILEHNVFRYYKVPNGPISQQIARRESMNDTSDEDIKGLISSIKTMRADLPRQSAICRQEQQAIARICLAE